MATAVVEERDGEGVKEAMPIFSEDPVSFKIDRKSHLAARLNHSISRELLRFLKNYSDDVLAEYITVLVCNGKHQYQARDDLEAFLGERSEKFVSWLWNFLMKYAPQSSINEDIPISQFFTVTSPHENDAGKDVRMNELKDCQYGGNGDAHNEAPTGDAVLPCSPLKSNTLPSNNMEFSKGSQHFVGLVSHIGFPTTGEQGCQRMNSHRKVGSSHCNSLPSQISVPVPQNAQSNIPDESPKHALTADDSQRNFPPSPSHRMLPQTDKIRRSVWDRLGKPCDNIMNDGNTDDHVVQAINQKLGKESSSCFPPNEMQCKRYVAQNRKAENAMSAAGEIQVDSVRPKRHFDTVRSSPGIGLLHLIGEGDTYLQLKGDSKVPKKPKLAAEARGTQVTSFSPSAEGFDTMKEQSMAPKLKPVVAEMQDVKQKFLQLEKEMAELGSKWAKIKKDGKPNLFSSSVKGGLKHSEEDIDSRTVFVTNVHFAATKDALSKHFGRCGEVLHVSILSDITASQIKGSAYVTFACHEAVDRALALNGTYFFSRILKIVQKLAVAAETPAPATPAGKLPRTQPSPINRRVIPRLQWQRNPVPAAAQASRLTVSKEGKPSAMTSTSSSFR